MTTFLRTGRRARSAGVVGAALVVGTTLAACGGGSPAASSSTTTTKPTPSQAAFRTCLQQHGVTLPSRPRGSGTTGTGSFPPAGSGGGFPGGGGGGGGGFSSNPQFQQAFQACASLRPAGGGGGFFGGSGTANVQLKAYENCLSLHGVTIPSSGTAQGTALRQLLTNPTTKEKTAETACAALRPTFRRGSTSTTTTTVPA